MSRLLPRPADGGAEVDLSPLIDVVFILLIFFMVSTTYVKDAQVDIQRPGARSATPASGKALRVSLDAGGSVYVDDVAVRPWMVQTRVREAIAEGGSPAVLVIADRRVTAERLIEVVDQARLGGAQDVGVVASTEVGDGP